MAAYSSPAYQASRRGRGPGVALAIGANVLLALLFLTISSYSPLQRMAPTGLSTFNVAGSRPAPERVEKKAERKPRRTKRTAAAREMPAPKPPAPDASAPSPFKMIIVSKEVFGASDVGAIPKSAAPATGAASDSAAGAPTYGPGEGPGGSTLYAADWYRKPRDAELAYYMPREVRSGSWAEIACQTAERYRVENCRVLAESPRGSGLANALRRAAWQFQVRPPSIDGKPMLGAWVRIHFDFTEKARD